MAKDIKPKIVTKKHLARLERERLQKRYILWASIAVIVIAVGAILYGLVAQLIIKPAQPIAEVNGDKITTKAYQAQVRYYRQNLVARYQQGYQVYQMFAQSDPSTAQYFTQQLAQYSSQLADSQGLGQQVLDAMIEDAIIRQEAEKQGITVTDEEVNAYIQENFQFYPNGTPTPLPTDLPTPIPATLSATQLAMITATPTITPTAVPTITVTITPTATIAPTAEITSTTELTPTATPTPYTEELFNKDYDKYLSDVKTGANVDRTTVENVVRTSLLREKLIKKMFADLPKEEDQVWLRQVVGTTQETAQAAYDRIQAGEDFGAIAAELSADATAPKGGDMGWQSREGLPSGIADAAFSMEIGQISEPIETPNGWAVIQVVDKRTKTLSQSEYNNLQQTKYTDWLAEQRSAFETAGTLTINEEKWKASVPTYPAIPVGMELPTAQPQQ